MHLQMNHNSFFHNFLIPNNHDLGIANKEAYYTISKYKPEGNGLNFKWDLKPIS